jgi:AcrR family transcriptional regulator
MDVRARLQQAALELYRERGYERTTTAEIAAQAGVTERTFFRHFADKREILFDEDPRLRPALAAAVAGAPADAAPMEILLQTFQAIEPMLEENRPFTEPRLAIIARTPALQERADAKTASITALLASALQARGVETRLATLAAQAGMASFSYAASGWRERPSVSFGTHLVEAFETLQRLGDQDRQGSATRGQ